MSGKGVLAIPARVIATCFALIGFAAASVVGVAAGNPTSTVLLRATVVMLLIWGVGRVIGAMLQRTIEDHIRRYKHDHPIPDDASAVVRESTPGAAETADAAIGSA